MGLHLIMTILTLLSSAALAQPSFPDFTTGLPSSAQSIFVTADDHVIISNGNLAIIFSCTGTPSCNQVNSYLGGSYAASVDGVLVTTDGTNIYYFTCPSYDTCGEVASIQVFNGSPCSSLVLSNGIIFAGYLGSPSYVVPYTYSDGQLIQGTPSTCSGEVACPLYGDALAALDGQYATGDYSIGQAYYPSRNFFPTGSASKQFGQSVALGFDSSSGLQLFYVGAPATNFANGQVYVFTCDSSTCQSAFILANPSSGDDLFFGDALPANGNKLLVSQPWGGGPSGNGLIYYFNCVSTACTLISSFYPSYSTSGYGFYGVSIGTTLGAQIDTTGTPSVFFLSPTTAPSSSSIFSGSAFSPSSITSIPTVSHPRHDCLISNGVINDGGFTITTVDGTEYCCRFQGIIQGGQCGLNKCSSGFVAQGVSTYFENDDGSHCFTLCYAQGSGSTNVPMFQGSQYKPSTAVSLSANVQGGLDCLISSGTVKDAGYLVTDPSNNQYCCRFQGTYVFGVCTHQVCGISQPWSSLAFFFDSSNACYAQCFAS